jgi:hypothetical protein
MSNPTTAPDSPTPASGPTAQPPKDPQPSVDRIDGLAARILTGDILLPKFQRSFVWERPQILSLLDSVGRGYPIGSVLLWQSRQELRSENRIADLEIQLPKPDYPVNYLLDGQQRLSTICAAMHWQGPDPKSRWNLAYDLRQRQFIHLTSLDDPPAHQIRLNKLPDASSYFAQVAAIGASGMEDKDALVSRANDLFNRFKDYKVATVTLGDMSIEDVAPIFERINSTGTPLTIVDLMRAATWSPDFDLIDTLESILQVLTAKDFGSIDKKVVLRNLSAAAGGGFSADSIDELRKLSPQNLTVCATATEEAYVRAVDFLSTQIGIASAEVLPYSNQLTVLAEIFRRLPSPTSAQFDAIGRWFWRTALSGYFSGWNTGEMASDLSAVAAFAEDTTPEIVVPTQPPTAAIWWQRQFRSNNAHAKLLAIVLAHQGPVDLLTGQSIDTGNALAWTNQKEFHHFFPRDYLKHKEIPRQSTNCLANIVMLTSVSNKKISNRAPSDYLREVEAAAGDQLTVWLQCNLIPRDAFDYALADDFANYLVARAVSIHDTVLALAGWNTKDAELPAVDPSASASEAAAQSSEDSDYTVENPTTDAAAPS